MSNADLEARVAQIAGYYWATHSKASGTYWLQRPQSFLPDGWTEKSLSSIAPEKRSMLGCPRYLTDLNECLALLASHENWQFNMGRPAFTDEYFCSFGVSTVSPDGENVREDRFQGTGPTLPYAICRALVAAHGGTTND